MEPDVVAEMEPKMMALYATLDSDDLRKRLREHGEIAEDRRAPAVMVNTAWTAIRLITAELTKRELALESAA